MIKVVNLFFIYCTANKKLKLKNTPTKIKLRKTILRSVSIICQAGTTQASTTQHHSTTYLSLREVNRFLVLVKKTVQRWHTIFKYSQICDHTRIMCWYRKNRSLKLKKVNQFKYKRMYLSCIYFYINT